MAERVERRLRQIQAELDADRMVVGRNDELNNLSMDLRSVFIISTISIMINRKKKCKLEEVNVTLSCFM